MYVLSPQSSTTPVPFACLLQTVLFAYVLVVYVSAVKAGLAVAMAKREQTFIFVDYVHSKRDG